MAQLLTAKGIAERALRMVQAFAINDVAADPEELRETLYWMEMLIDHKDAVNKLNCFIPSDVLVPMPITASFNLPTAAGATWPTNGVLMFHHAMLADGSGRETPLRLLKRYEYEEIEQKTAAGRPMALYIDMLDPNYTAKQWPVPSDTSYTAKLVVQTYNLTVAIDNKAIAQQSNKHGFNPGWQLWLVYGTAALIGGGAVRAVPPAKVKEWDNKADELWDELYINADRERGSEPRITRSSDNRLNWRRTWRNRFIDV